MQRLLLSLRYVSCRRFVLGFVSLLEDAQDALDAHRHSYQRWRSYTATHDPKPLKRKRRRKRSILAAVSDYVKRADEGTELATLQEAIDLHGDPFDWPRRLVARFYASYRGDNGAAIHGRLGAHVEAMTELNQLLTRIDSLEPDSAGLPEALAELKADLARFFEEHPSYGLLSVEAMERAARQSQEIAHLQDRTYSDLLQFCELAAPALSHSAQFAEVQKAVNRLNDIGQELEADLEQADEFVVCCEDIQRRWARFLELHAVAWRDRRPRVAELSRLNLTEDQEQIVSHEYDCHWRVQGTSGSGKTLVVIHRALRLAQRDGSKVVRVFTLSRGLSDLMGDIARRLNGGRLPHNLRIEASFDFIERCLSLFSITSYRPLASQWMRYRNKNYSTYWARFFGGFGHRPHKVFAEGLRTGKTGKKKGSKQRPMTHVDLHGALTKRGLTQIEASAYLLDECRYIQSALPQGDRDNYLTMPRTGRALKLGKNQRQMMLRVLRKWEQWLDGERLWDQDYLVQKAWPFFTAEGSLERIRQAEPAHHILFDEVQDFSTMELRLLSMLMQDPTGPNRFFFAGDLNQKVRSRHHEPVWAGFNFKGRGDLLSRNFRNTREILRAAYRVIEEYPPQVTGEVEVLTPQLSSYSGAQPLVVKSLRSNQDVFIYAVLAQCPDRRVAVASNDEETFVRIHNGLRERGQESYLVVGTEASRASSNCLNLLEAPVLCGRMETLKGFEFDTVILADASKGILPFPSTPGEEHWREAATFYSALTRARDELIITYVDKPSPFLQPMMPQVDFQDITSNDDAIRRAIGMAVSRQNGRSGEAAS